MKFVLLAGKHQVPDPTRPANPAVPDGPRANITYGEGDTIESEVDLVKQFNSRGSEKFRRVRDDTPISSGYQSVHDMPSPEEKMETIRQQQQGELGGLFEGKTVAELKLLASDNGINLAGATKKDEIIAKIREELDEARSFEESLG